MRGRGTARETGGSMPIDAIFARKAMREGFEIDDEILTVFERFEGV
jgi:hypothetical protein